MNPGSYSQFGVISKLQVVLQNLPGVSDNQEVLVPCTSNSQTIDVIKNIIKLVPELRSEDVSNLEIVEVLFTDGMSCKERSLHKDEFPIVVQRLWPCALQNNASTSSQYKLVLRRKCQEKMTYFGNLCVEGSGKYLTGLMTKRRARDYPDLCNLPELNEITLLENLKKRFENNSIYTYIGSILISINPFYYFPIYNPKFVEMYQNRSLSDLPPHIFAIADAAYHNMVTNKKNQCIVISGESGSGKTENANFLLHHLSALSQRNFYSNGIEKHIAGVGPVLEAFGNAKTVHNNNSSRFGKFVQVSYREDGTVYGATVEKYLLEKSRIVSQAACERNYHVFYYLVAGANESEKTALHLTDAPDYFYLNQDRRSFIPSKDEKMEAQEFNRLKNAMDAVGFSSEVQSRLFVVLSAILHLGNIGFRKRAELGHHDECVAVKNADEVSIVSQLLKVSETTLLDALTKRRTQAGGEVVVMSNRLDEAISTRNSTAKCLYSALFDWIVYKINALLLFKHSERRSQGNCIGVLDIFGFEDFHDNSFEQFCINYANENLHYYFNQHIFKLEQEEYTREGILWENIEFIDNTGCLELFSKKPSGLLHLLDEESNFPGATNETLLSKFHTNHQNNAYYEVPQTKQSAFGIVHYAGKVKYSIQDFREKNIDLMRNDILMLFKSSKMSFIKELIGQDPLALMRWSLVRVFFKACYAFIDAGRRHKKNSNNCKYKVPQMKPFNLSPKKKPSHPPIKHSLSLVDEGGYLGIDGHPNAVHHCKGLHTKVKSRHFQTACNGRKDLLLKKTPPGSRKSKNKPPSISAQFHVSLLQLTETLNQAMPSFIRCIKSNSNKAKKTFDEELVGSQLRYTGMLATVKIRQSGYNYRQPFEDFVLHFHPLLPRGKQSSKEDIDLYLNRLDIDKNNFQLGETKVFLREKEKLFLEEKLHEALLLKIVVIQNWVKAKLKRRSFLKMRSAAIIIQSHVRCFIKRNEYLKLKTSCIRIQSWYKGCMMRTTYKQLQARCTYLQRCAKTYLTNHRHRAQSEDSVDIQTFSEELVTVDGEERRSSSPLPHFVSEFERTTSYEMTFNVGQVARRFRKEGKLEIELTIGSNNEVDLSAERDDTISELCETDESMTTTRDQMDSTMFSDDVFPYRLHERDMSSLDVDVPPSSGPPSNDIFAPPTSHPKLKSKSHSISSQAGPEDIEIEVKKVVCHERTFPTSGSRCKFEAFEEKEVKAPLAVEEVFSDDIVTGDENESGFEVRTISIDNDNEVFRDESVMDKRKESKIKEESQQKSNKSNKKSSMKKSNQQPVVSSWKCSSTTQWKYPLDLIVENLKQLRQLEQYLSQKMIYMGKLNKERGNKDSVYDEVFKASLTEFHTNLITQISTAKETTETQVVYSYERLMKLVEDILRAKSRNKCLEDSMPFFINAFRGFLDEFIKKKEMKELPEIKSRRLIKKSKKETVLEHLGHKFLLIQFNIPTYCEVCQNILWVFERGYTCKVCKLTLHKKCFSKVLGKCGGSADDEAVASRLGRTIIGSPLEVLSRETPTGCKVHPMVERLMNAIEMDGLYTEGLYRKPGMASAVKQLIKDINNDHQSVDFRNYPIHVLTAVLKAFFREMPEPLMTFELYQDFIRFTDIENEKEKMRALYSLVDRLPQVNHDLLERLIFHLAKVALQEESNRMNTCGLAIIFAPSILRTSQNLPMQESFLHVPRQSACIQFLIESQMEKMISTLRHIETINKDTIDVSDKLATLRASRKRMSVEEMKAELEDESGEQVKNLAYQIKSLQRKKQELTEQLPSMSYRRSFSEDVRFSSEEGESVAEDYDDESLLSSQSSGDHISHFSESDAFLMR